MGKNTFKYINRHRKKDAVLLHGWASDSKIFDLLNINYNYIIVEDFDPFTFQKNLVNFLQNNNFRKISIFGWSMGGFAGADFATKYDYLIDDLILCSVKEKYEKKTIQQIKSLIRENKSAFLYKFFRDCFSEFEKKLGYYDWFRKNLQSSYLHFDVESLLIGLDYLENTCLETKKIESFRLKLIFGLADKIINAKEALSLKNELKNADFLVMENRGHIPFIELQGNLVDEGINFLR